MRRKSIIINGIDNVAVLLEDANKGDDIVANGEIITLLEDITFAHKVAIVNFKEEEDVYKYGQVIGYVTKDVAKGEWIHTHNMDCRRGHVRKETK